MNTSTLKPNWIERKIMPEIMAAIRAQDRCTYIFYITGAEPGRGGNGKTILLRQIGIALGSEDGMKKHFPFSGILDLYDSEVNNRSRLEILLNSAFETHLQFQPFRNARESFNAWRQAGVTGDQLEAARQAVGRKFAECLNTITKEHRLVIAFDTAERLQHELDSIQTLCGLKEESTTVKEWLLDQMERWQNCVVLLAGRAEAHPYLRESLEARLANKPHIHYKHLVLGGFNAQELDRYSEIKRAEFPAIENLTPDERLQLGRVTEGHPLLLDLALEVLQHQPGADRFLRNIVGLSSSQARREIDELLIKQVMSGEPDPMLRETLRYLSIARKGLDATRLRHLAETWSIEDCEKRLNALKDRSFVKLRPDGRLFLHDEMYDLCDRHTAPETVRQLSARMVKWYEDQLQPLEQQISAFDDRQTLKVEEQKQLAELRDRREDLQVDSLLYRLRENPRSGYDYYVRLSETTIRVMRIGFDMRLRGEVLSFLSSNSVIGQKLIKDTLGLHEEIDFDCASRWVLRLEMRGEFRIASQVGARAMQEYAAWYKENPERYRLPQAALRLYWAEALIHVGESTKAIELFQEVIADLEGDKKPEELALDDPRGSGWRRNFILGRTHNNLGYVYWMQKMQYALALEHFKNALPYFRASDLLEEYANTSDNIGRVYARLGEKSRAEALIEDGWEIRKRLHYDYRIGLSLVSNAIVKTAFGKPYSGRALSRQALKIFDDLQAQRGIGLTCIALGSALRAIGALWATGIVDPEHEECLVDAIEKLKRAEEIFKKQVDEPVRLIQVYNEMGCVHRERAALVRERSEPLAQSSAQQAIDNLERSIQLADEYEMPVMYADGCEDLAQTYFQQGEYEIALAQLERAEKKIPAEYRFRPRAKLATIPPNQCVEEFWQMLGKIELLRGHTAFEQKLSPEGKVVDPNAVRKAAEHYAFAEAYFERFSPEASRLETTDRQVHSRFRKCKIVDLEQIQKEVLPQLAKEYPDLASPRLRMFFEDTTGIPAVEPTE